MKQVIVMFLTATLLLVATAIVRADETLNNAGVIELKKAGMGDAVIANKIKASKCDFDISTNALKSLKDAGLSDEIISLVIDNASKLTSITKPTAAVPAISNDPAMPHDSGIWVFQEQGSERQMVKLKEESSGRSTGWNKKSRATLYGSSATLQVAMIPAPTFYYYEEKPAEKAFAPAIPTTTANDLILVKMEVRVDKNDRRLALGKDEFFGGTTSGLDPTAYVAVNVEKVSDGVYRITPVQELKSGEYCFIDKRHANRESLKHGDVELYDFGFKK